MAKEITDSGKRGNFPSMKNNEKLLISIHRYETSDGSTRSEIGLVKNSYLTVKGSFEFVGEDGETYVINYVADEKGFRPEGDHIPQV